MSGMQKYGIKYPFTHDNDEGIFLDLNETYADGIKSQVLHVIFTPKGRKLRDPDFGTDLIRFIYEPDDSLAISDIKTEITSQILKYVPSVEFRDIQIHKDDENGIVAIVEYATSKGNTKEITTIGVKL